MLRLVVEEFNRGIININKEEVNKGFFVVVVGVVKGVRDSGVFIQLIFFNREEFVERRRAVEFWILVFYFFVVFVVIFVVVIGEKGRGYEEIGGRNTLKMKN